jgi:hypothetical protein
VITLIEGCVERIARKRWKCDGDGARPARYAPGHTPTIEPGELCVEFSGETPPYQSSPHVCMACAKAFYRADRSVRNEDINPKWLDARGEASAILDRFLVSLRYSGNLIGTVVNASGPGGPYVDCINALASLVAPESIPEGTEPPLT